MLLCTPTLSPTRHFISSTRGTGLLREAKEEMGVWGMSSTMVCTAVGQIPWELE